MYEDMTFEGIQDKMLSRIRNDIDKREGSIIWDAVGPVAYYIAQMYFQLENYLDLIYPDTSAASYLDRCCLAYGLSRKQATKAVRKITASGALSVGSRWQYQDTSYTVTSQADDGTYTAECEQAGNTGNIYFGELQPLDYGSGEAVLGEVLSAGTDEESDDSLRERLLNKIRCPSTSGNANDYYNWAMECAGVGAARVFPLADGPGTVRVVIVDSAMGAAGKALTDAVKQHTDGLRPIGATVSVVSAAEMNVNISAKVRLNGSGLGAVQNAFRDAVTAYFRQSAFSAAYVSPARIGSLLLGVAGVDDYAGLCLNGAAENVTVGPEEVAVTGTVRLEVISDGNQ